MNKKKTGMMVGILVVVVLIIIVAAIASNKKAPVEQTQTNEPQTTNEQTNAPVGNDVTTTASGTVVQDKFRAEVPKDIKVPEVGEKLTEEQVKTIAVPTVVTAAAPGASAQFRSFDIKAEGGKYTPSTIIGRVGDTIHVNFNAVDKDYDIVFPSYNMKQTATKGQTKILEFQAVQEGSFTYYCEMCGGANGPTKGSIVIAK